MPTCACDSHRKWRRFGGLAGALLLAACTAGAKLDYSDYKIIPITPQLVATQQKEAAMPLPTAAKKPQAYSYRLGAGDVLAYRLWDGVPQTGFYPGTMADSAIMVKVEESGAASFPGVGAIAATGKTMAEVRTALQKKLSLQFKQPRFDVQLAEAKSARITVSGAVAKPGVQALGMEPLSVQKALEQAGGPHAAADLSAVALVHEDGSREVLDLAALMYRADLSQDRVMRAGDTLLFSENHRNRVFVMGEAIRAGARYIPAGKLSLTEAINDAQSPGNDPQGPNRDTALIGNIYVIRGALPEEVQLASGEGTVPVAPPDENHVVIYELDPSQPVNYAVADQFLLKPRDIVYISASAVTEWRRFFSQIVPSNFGIARVFN